MRLRTWMIAPLLISACNGGGSSSSDATMSRTDAAPADGALARDGGSADGALAGDDGGRDGRDGGEDGGAALDRDASRAPGTSILFEEPFDEPEADLMFAFDRWLFGFSDVPWTRSHRTAGGVRGSPYFRATSTYDAYGIGANHYFQKNFDGALAEHDTEFSARQCMRYSNGYFDARVVPLTGAPKINYFTGSHGGLLYYSLTSGAFVARERVIGQTSGARADLFTEFPGCAPGCGDQRVTNVVGTFTPGETIEGQVSGATATVNRLEPEGRVLGMNHFWHPGAPPSYRGDGLAEVAWFDITVGDYFGSNSPQNLVQHENHMILQEHYDEWLCLETLIDINQVPWNIEIYVTTEAGAATLAAGTTALDGAGRRQFNDYLYIRYQNPYGPAVERGFGIESTQWGAYGEASVDDFLEFDEYVIATGHVGHPF